MEVKPKKKSGCLFWGLGIVGAIVLIIGGLFWKVYSDLDATSQKIYQPVETNQIRTEVVTPAQRKPISFLLLGVDTGDYGRTEQGRSDAMLVMTANPETQHSTLLSIPRDTRSEIIGRGTMDKVNHAYAFGGVVMSINTVQNLLNVPIDYYVEVNMGGLRDILAAVGEITVTPNATFELNGYNFVEGQPTTLNADSVLSFVRERHVDSDYGRQERQRMVIMAIVKKMASLESIANYATILDTLSNNMQTNLTFEDLQNVFANYRQAAGNISQVQLSGEGTMIDGIYYSIPDATQLRDITNTLRTELGMSTIE